MKRSIRRLDLLLAVISLIVLGIIAYLLLTGIIVLRPYTMPNVPSVG